MTAPFCSTRPSNRSALLIALMTAILLITLAGCRNGSKPTLLAKPVFRQDLRPFGFPTEAEGRIVGNFSELNFLSDDAVMVTVNTRAYGVDESHPDEPPSRFLLFDLARRTLVKTAEIPVDKASGFIKAVENGGFVVLNRAGLHLCSGDLECGASFKSRGPLFVSPAGTRIAIGGGGKTEQHLLDGATLNQIDQFPWFDPAVIPGDSALVIVEDGKLYLRQAGNADQPLPFNTDDLRSSGAWPEARFLSANRIAGLVSDKTVAVAGPNGNVLYRIPVRSRSHLIEIATSASGSRFVLHEAGYTFFKSILAFLDTESGRPFNSESVNVIETDSGKSRFRLRWNPRPYVGDLGLPALSPNGRRIAIIRHGFLEVFQIK